MKYKIGDVSKMLGVSTDLLRYYEKKGIVHPQKDPMNDYRYYEAWDISNLLDCLWFKTFDFSMEEISHLVSADNYEDMSDRLEAKAAEMEESIRRQQELLDLLKRQQKAARHAREMLGQCNVVESTEVLCYMNRHNFAYDEDPAGILLTKAWLQHMPRARRCFEVYLDDLPGMQGNGNFSWGLSLSPDYAREHPELIQPPVKRLPARTCIHSVFKSTGKEAFSPKNFDYLLKYAEANGYVVCDHAYGYLLCSVVENGGQTGYFEVWIPIE